MDDIKNVIELNNVTKDYGDFKLDNVSFSVPEGSVCGFIGQNGAGKTTLIRYRIPMICRLTLTQDGRPLVETRVPVYQLGKEASYPAK